MHGESLFFVITCFLKQGRGNGEPSVTWVLGSHNIDHSQLDALANMKTHYSIVYSRKPQKYLIWLHSAKLQYAMFFVPNSKAVTVYVDKMVWSINYLTLLSLGTV
jgi:hypothetical protein